LDFTKTAGNRHDAIPDAKRCKLGIAESNQSAATFTEDPAWFKPKSLETFRDVIFCLTTGDVLNGEQQTALHQYLEGGGGFIGMHAALDTEYDWPFYGSLVGAWFRSHPAIQNATIHVEDGDHPTTKFLPKVWPRRDEWYDFRASPRGKVHVLLTVDEKTYTGGLMGEDHPITWCRDVSKGRSWCTALGHTSESYSEPLFVRMLDEGIKWASRANTAAR
jgi:type 1 glutamine amidotransferase